MKNNKSNYKKQLCKVVITQGDIDNQFNIDIRCAKGVSIQDVTNYMTATIIQTLKEVIGNENDVNIYALKDNVMSMLNSRFDNFINELVNNIGDN